MHLCKGCGNPFKRSGLLHHFRQSENPACCPPQNKLPTEHSPPETVSKSASDETGRKQRKISTDPYRDFFGNYAEYSVDDFGMEVCEDEDDGLGEVMRAPNEEDYIETEEEDEAELADAVRAEEEAGLEPERPQAQENVVDHFDGQDKMGPALRLRGGAEEALSNKP